MRHDKIYVLLLNKRNDIFVKGFQNGRLLALALSYIWF